MTRRSSDRKTYRICRAPTFLSRRVTLVEAFTTSPTVHIIASGQGSPLVTRRVDLLSATQSFFSKRRSARAAEVEAQLLDIHRTCSSLVQRRAARIVGNDAAAQDIAQQVFIRVLDELQAGTVLRNPAAYCYQAATNLALNWLRDSRRRDELLAQQSWQRHEEASAEGTFFVQQMLLRCGEEEAVVAAYHYIDGLDQTEIAKLLGTSRRSVNRRLEKFNEQAKALMTDPSAAPPSQKDNAHG